MHLHLTPSPWIALLCGLFWTAGAPVRSQPAPPATPVFESIHVAILPEGQQVAQDGIHRARLDQAVTLHAVVVGRLNGRRIWVSTAPGLELSGRRVPTRALIPPRKEWNIELRWHKVQPTGQSYDNTVGGFHWDRIDYLEKALGPFGQQWSWPADAHPIGDYPDDHQGAGTMGFKVELRAGPLGLASPGAGSYFRGGLGPGVPRVAFRSDDTFLGRLSELFNTPYIWGSAGTKPADHQAERLIGSDCADFVVYGARRLGRNLPYRASWHLPEVTDTIARGHKVDAKGRFLDRRGRPLQIGPKHIQVGDLLLFKGHVGALVEDRDPVGVLDTNDVMLHTYWAPPAREPLKDTAYAKAKVRILRWK